MLNKSTFFRNAVLALAVVAGVGGIAGGARADDDDWRGDGYRQRQWEYWHERQEAQARYWAEARREAWQRHEWQEHRQDQAYYPYRQHWDNDNWRDGR
jgi:hypothetical protein